jgi:fucose 4-O-acetylase-like acetyltransferase
MASDEGNAESSSKNSSKLPFWLDIGTKGGAVFWSLVLFIVPIIGYNIVTGVFGVDEIEAGKWIGVGFTAFALLAWGSTYLFRVATKDMTYVSASDIH